ncbi:MAG TPA: non-reducing end alpha-L-arabinofuranosidase family hydrolase, partial [Opitutus sp.]|nr:non-reducing end alpha-L-arabinofuranosidase family hydrolase [Opitutus sp.]
HCAPQVFYFRPQNKWYLIYQSAPPSYSTTDDIEKPATWTPPKFFFTGTPASVVQGWIDFWIICDDTHAYLFFSDDNGRYYRSSTTLEDFPNGFSDPVVIMQDPNRFNLFEGSCVYRLKGLNEYLCFIECLGPTGHRFFRAFTSGRLDGDWTPLAQANSWDTPFAGVNNVTAADGSTLWTADISHGEMLRDTNDETMTIDPNNLHFLYQGADRNATSSDYSQIPYRLALLQEIRATQSPDTPPSQVIGVTAPANVSVTRGDSATFSVSATGAGPFTWQWQRNGLDLPGATSASLALANVTAADAGYYTAAVSDGVETATSAPAALGVSISGKVADGATEFTPDIRHPNGNIYDQVLLTGDTASVTADPGQAVRISYIDSNDDIVQVELAGAGTLSLHLYNASGPAQPVNYHQPDVTYMKGNAGIVVTGADESTNLSIFTVGRATAFDPTGAYNFLATPGATNDPARNGSPLFTGHADTDYDGFADVADVAIASADGRFGGLRAANARFSATAGFTGVYAPGIQFQGPVYVHDIAAFDTASPVLLFSSATDVRVTGGSLYQDNARPVVIDSTQLVNFTDGTSSAGTLFKAQSNLAHFERLGLDITGLVVRTGVN